IGSIFSVNINRCFRVFSEVGYDNVFILSFNAFTQMQATNRLPIGYIISIDGNIIDLWRSRSISPVTVRLVITTIILKTTVGRCSFGLYPYPELPPAGPSLVVVKSVILCSLNYQVLDINGTAKEFNTVIHRLIDADVIQLRTTAYGIQGQCLQLAAIGYAVPGILDTNIAQPAT